MKITITGRHMQVHDSVKDYATEKAGKLERFNDALRHVEVILSQEGDRKKVEMVATSRGGRHVGQVEHEDAFAAIDILVDKMKRQLERTKEKRKNRKHNESARHMQAGEPPSAKGEKDEELESYDDVIEKMEL